MRTTITAALVGLLIGAGVAVGAPRMGTFRPPIAQIQDNGTLMPYEPALNLSGTGVSCTDDSANMRTTCTITASGGSDGGGVTDATYITQIPDVTLTNEQALSLNSTGIMISTTGTGVVSTYAGASCTNQFPRSFNASGVATCASVNVASDVVGTLHTSNGGTSTPFGSVFKAARATTTANIALSGLLTVDGVILVSGDRVLVKNQTAATENGVYVAAIGAWSFALDWGTGAVVPMMVVDVAEGTQNQHSTWVLNTTGTIVVGTTALSFGPLNTNFPSRWPLAGSTVRVSATDPNADFQTIQTAIDATGPAPTIILVGPGTYTEALSLSGARTVKVQGVTSTSQSTNTVTVSRTGLTSADASIVTLTATGTSAPDIEFENVNFILTNTAPSAAVVSLFRSIESGLGAVATTRVSLDNCTGTLTELETVITGHSISAIKSIFSANLSTAVVLRDTTFTISNGFGIGAATDVSVWQMQGLASDKKDTLTLYGTNSLTTSAGAGNTKSIINQSNLNNLTVNWGTTRFSQNGTLPAFTVSPGTLLNWGSFARLGTTIKFFDSPTNVFNTTGTPSTNFIGEWTSTTPTVPTEGTSVFSRKRAGQNRTAQVATTNRWREFASPRYGAKIGVWEALGNGTVVGLLGLANNATGTATARNVATTNLSTSMRRLGYVSAATAGSSAGTRHNIAQWWFGNAAGLGGFFYSTRFIISQTNATVRWFVGLSATTAALANADPTTLLNLIGFSINSAQTAIRFINNDGSGAATATDLGASFPATTTTAVYEARFFVAPNTTVVNYSLERLDSAALIEGSVNTNTPSSTTFLSPQIWINNGSTASAVAIDVASQYIESDF